MIADLKPYPMMKDSGVEWLGAVPEHWEVRPLCAVGSPKSITGQQHLQLLSVYLDRGVIRFSEAEEKRTNVTSEDLTKYQVVAPGDFVLNNQQAWRGSVGVSNYCGIVSPAYLVLSLSHKLISSFANLLFRDQVMVTQYVVCSRGVGTIQRNLYWPHLRRAVCPLPPLPEQAAIVRFLDHADRRIRRYIRAKQKLVKLLEEQKQAIIHQAVTGRIDVRTGQPYPAYKPSGVEWLGEIPGHWEVRRLKSLVRCIDQGVSPQADNYLADGNAWGVLKAGCVNGGVFREREHKRLAFDFVFDPVLAVSPGDVLVSRASGSAHLVGSAGRVSALRYRLILSDKTFRLIFKQEVDPDFMVLAMNGHYYRQQVEQAISGAEGLANNLPLSSLRAFHFVVPNIDEQRNVVAYVRTVADKLGAAASRAWREASLVDEYRTRLIADVVTGKLDVREAAAGLPEVDPLADEFDGLTTQAAETDVMELEDATESSEELAMENEATV